MVTEIEAECKTKHFLNRCCKMTLTIQPYLLERKAHFWTKHGAAFGVFSQLDFQIFAVVSFDQKKFYYNFAFVLARNDPIRARVSIFNEMKKAAVNRC